MLKRVEVFKKFVADVAFSLPDLEIHSSNPDCITCAITCLLMKQCSTYSFLQYTNRRCQFIRKKGVCMNKEEFRIETGSKVFHKKV